MARSTLLLIITAVVVLGAVVIMTRPDTAPSPASTGEGARIEAPGTKVETDGDKTRVQAPGVDITVPRDKTPD